MHTRIDDVCLGKMTGVRRKLEIPRSKGNVSRKTLFVYCRLVPFPPYSSETRNSRNELTMECEWEMDGEQP